MTNVAAYRVFIDKIVDEEYLTWTFVNLTFWTKPGDAGSPPGSGKTHGGFIYAPTVNPHSRLASIEVYVDTVVGTPTDTVRVGIWDATKSVPSGLPADALFISSEEYDNGDIGSGGWFEFSFNEFYPQVGKIYYVAAYRTGDSDSSNYWALAQDSDLNGDKSSLGKWETTGWFGSNDAATYKIHFDDVDLSNDVTEVTASRGKSDTSGDFDEGSCDITLKNKSGKYCLDRDDSILFTIFDIGVRLRVEATYDSVTYDLFDGIIERVAPDTRIADREVYVELVDKFHKFKEQRVSPGALVGKTADELIEEIMDELGLVDGVDYTLDADSNVLNDVTWNDVKAFDKLKEVVEVGQHHHFVDGAGVYRFKNNQWLAAGDPDFTYELPDPCREVSDFSIDYDRKNIINRVRVWYLGDNWTTWALDQPSIDAYGQKDFQLENSLMPTQVYAEGLRDYILDLKKGVGGDLKLQLENEMPDILKMNLGDKILFTEDFTGVAGHYSVLNLEHNILPAGEHSLSVICNRWVNPPILESWYDYIPFTTQWYLILSPYRKAQCFQVPTTGNLLQITITMFQSPWANENNTLRVFAADGSGHPTGSILAESEPVYIRGEALYTFPFVGAEQIAINSASKYCFDMDQFSAQQAFGLKGSKGNEETAGPLAHYDSGWVDAGGGNWDAYMEVRLKT